MVKTRISSKGQTTIPIELRKEWKSSRLIWTVNADGSALVRPVPDVMSLYGKAGNSIKKKAHEFAEAEEAIATEKPVKRNRK